MSLTLAGTMEQRVLVNFRIDPGLIEPHLPPGFRAALVADHAIVGICLIQLRVGPARFPRWLGLRSWCGAHRVAVFDPSGQPAVYVPHRHTDSRLATVLGGRIIPGVLRRAAVTGTNDDDAITVHLRSYDGDTSVEVAARLSTSLPPGSAFADLGAASAFFQKAAVGYSDARGGHGHLDAIELRTRNWSVAPLAVDRVTSSYFDDADRFPIGSVVLDHALLMRDIDHSWHRAGRSPLAATRP